MKKKVIAFYDLLLYAIICIPLVIIAAISLFMILKGTDEKIFENWYLVLSFAIAFVLPIAGTMLFRYYVINNNSIHFHYFTFAASWGKAANNIDIR